MATDLYLAIEKEDYRKAVSIIRHGCNVDAMDADSKTPLISCSLMNDEQTAIGLSRMLIEKGCRASSLDRYGMSALHYSCQRGLSRLTSLLLASSHNAVNERCRIFKNTPLHYAVMSGSEDCTRAVLRYLSRYTMDPHVRNKDNLAPVSLAKGLGFTNIYEMLRDVDTEYCAMKSYRNPTSKYGSGVSEIVTRPIPRINISLESSKQCMVRSGQKQTFPALAKVQRNHSLRSRAACEQTWKDELPAIWSHYQQQHSRSFRWPAVPLPQPVITEPNREVSTPQPNLLPRKEQEGLDLMPPLPLYGSRRRHSSITHLSPNIKASRRASVISQGRNMRHEAIKARRQSIAV